VFLEESVRREKRQVFVAAIGIALAVMVLAPPIVQAATQKVNIVKSKALTVKKVNEPVRVANGSAIQSRNLGAFGELPNQQAQFPTKALSVATVAGGGGFHDAAGCTDDGALDPSRTVTVEATAPGSPPNIVTGVLMSSPGGTPITVTVTAPDVSASPIIALRNSAEEPTKFIGFGNGLTVSPSDLIFECPAGSDISGASFVILGQ
jgi:hypothetical protein